jgi:type II restriction/modification system DNA methylase subunit YeeA
MEQAECYRVPFAYIRENVLPERIKNNRPAYRERWWIYAEARPGMRASIDKLSRFIVTTKHAKYRYFTWSEQGSIVNNSLNVIASDQDFMFGVLNSGVHVAWATRKGTTLGVGNDSRYTPTTTFETFPFPQPTPEQRAKVEAAARYLEQARVFLLGKDAPNRKSGMKLGLTDIYNLLTAYRLMKAEPVAGLSTLADAHDLLDQVVADAYGWTWPLSEDEMLTRLLDLNLHRAGHTPA